jgi:hypothetical protein
MPFEATTVCAVTVVKLILVDHCGAEPLDVSTVFAAPMPSLDNAVPAA